MENASKALILAGSLLISLIIISMLLLMVNSLTSYQAQDNVMGEIDILAAFNAEYEAYNRDNVRGNELYTLANKVIDYNRRKTANIAQDVDVGSTIGYKPITLTINFKNNNYLLAYDDINRLFTKNEYKTSEGSINDLEDVWNEIQAAEVEIGKKYNVNGKDSLNLLASNITAIYTGRSNMNATLENDRKDMISAIKKVNQCLGKEQFEFSENDISKINFIWNNDICGDLKQCIYKYYEFLQFKREIFKCTSVGYDQKETGRVVSINMSFEGIK